MAQILVAILLVCLGCSSIYYLPGPIGYTIDLIHQNKLKDFFTKNPAKPMFKHHMYSTLTLSYVGYCCCCIGMLILFGRNLPKMKQCFKIF